MRINNDLEKGKLFFTMKKKIFLKNKNSHFGKGLIHAFGQKMPNFYLFKFGQNKTRKNA